VQPELDGVLVPDPLQDARGRVDRRRRHRPQPAVGEIGLHLRALDPLRPAARIADLDALGGDPLDHVVLEPLYLFAIALLVPPPRPQPWTGLERRGCRGRRGRQRRVFPRHGQIEHRLRAWSQRQQVDEHRRQTLVLVAGVEIIALEVRRQHSDPSHRRVGWQRIGQPSQPGCREGVDEGGADWRAHARGAGAPDPRVQDIANQRELGTLSGGEIGALRQEPIDRAQHRGVGGLVVAQRPVEEQLRVSLEPWPRDVAGAHRQPCLVLVQHQDHLRVERSLADQVEVVGEPSSGAPHAGIDEARHRRLAQSRARLLVEAPPILLGIAAQLEQRPQHLLLEVGRIERVRAEHGAEAWLVHGEHLIDEPAGLELHDSLPSGAGAASGASRPTSTSSDRTVSSLKGGKRTASGRAV
jgi:hypothetical protein